MAAPLFQAAGIICQKPDWAIAAAVLLGAGTAGVLMAGHVFHAEPLNATVEIREVFALHERYALYTLWAALTALALKAAARARHPHARRIELAALGPMLAAAVLVAVTGHLGAELTHIFKVQAE